MPADFRDWLVERGRVGVSGAFGRKPQLSIPGVPSEPAPRPLGIEVAHEKLIARKSGTLAPREYGAPAQARGTVALLSQPKYAMKPTDPPRNKNFRVSSQTINRFG